MNTDVLLLTAVIAVTVEALVEYGKTVLSAWQTARSKVIVQLSAVIVSVCLCLLVGGDVFTALGVRFAWTPIGSILTGVFAARGANFLSDFVGRLRAILHKT